MRILARQKWRRRILLGSTLCLSLLIPEIALRISKGKLWSIENFLLRKVNLLRSSYPVVVDPELGWAPKPKTIAKSELWPGCSVTILDNGLRSNGNRNHSRSERSAILTVGDSFTFGDEVSDDESWPALLEQKSGYSVLNGGVFAYGLDQSILRAESILKTISSKPRWLIVGMVPDDIERCEYRAMGRGRKPCFNIERGGLELSKEGLGTRDRMDPFEPESMKRILGYSLLVHFFMDRYYPQYWLIGRSPAGAHVHKQGEQVAALLLNRLDHLCAEEDLNCLVLIQDYKDTDPQREAQMQRIVSQARLNSARVLDLIPDLLKEKKKDPDFGKLYRNAHMSPAGNAWVARKVLARIGAATALDRSAASAR